METSLTKLYKQHDKIREQLENLVKAKIVKFCDQNEYSFGVYVISHTVNFVSKHGNEIQGKQIDRFIKMINDFIDHCGLWDGQFSYDPAKYNKKEYKDFYMEHLTYLKRIGKKL